MRFLWKLIAFGVAATVGSAQVPGQTIRVGTFHKPSVVVAFYRSPLWAERLKGRLAEMDSAKKANDTKRVQELQDWGAKQQDLAHKQLAGEAPISNVLDALASALPEIARKAEAAMIVPDLPYATALVQTVDVTDQLLDWLKADEATRKIARDLRNRQVSHSPQ